MKLGDALEVIAGILAVAGAWYRVGLWLALPVAAVYVFYLAQVYANTGKPEPEYGSLAAVSIGPGDTVIARIHADVTSEDFAAAQAYMQKQLPDNRVVVLPGSVEIGSWRPRGYVEPEPVRVRRRDRFKLWG